MTVYTQANRAPIGKFWRSMPGRPQSRGAWQLRRPSRCLALGLFLLLALPALSSAQQPQPWQLSPLASGIQLLDPSKVKTGPLAKLGGTLMGLHREYEEYTSSRSAAPFVSRIPLAKVQEAMVTIDAVAATDASALQAKLEALGLQNGASFGAMVSGQLPITALPAAAALAELRFARPAMSTSNVGATTSQGDPAQVSNTARTTFGIDGGGITVGHLSDSLDCLMGLATDIGTGDLSAPIIELSTLCPSGVTEDTDEGRALMQIVQDVAPGAAHAFHTAFLGMADFALGIEEIAGCPPGSEAGCGASPLPASVIIDDVIYLAEPMFQDGIIAQAVDTVKSAGVAYFSSAGNQSRRSYESPSGFIASVTTGPNSGPLYDFDPAAADDPFQNITIPVGSGTTISFQWDSPFASVCGCPGSLNDVDIFLTGDGAGMFTLLAGSAIGNVGGDAVEVFSFINTGAIDIDGIPGADTTFNIIIELFSGSGPGLLKYVRFDAGPGVTLNQFDTASSSLYGHANAAGAEAVGAAFYFDTPPFGTDPPLLEPFSSAGPTDILFDITGMPTFEMRDKPEIVAPDGGNTTFFGSDIEPDGFPNFFGTSPSAAHAAGVAALLLDLTSSSLTPSGVYQVLEASATDMGPPGFDFDSGYGLINALKAAQSTAPVSAACGVDDLKLDGTPNVTTQIFRACKTIEAGPGQFDDVTLIAGNGVPGTVTLHPGFKSGGPLTIRTSGP